MAADAASTQSPLVKRLRMIVIPSCGLLGRPPAQVAWAVKLWPATADDVVTVTLCDRSLSVSDHYRTMSSRFITRCWLPDTAWRLRDWPDTHELDVWSA